MTSNTKKSDWLDIVENLSVLSAIGGSIASVVFQQIGFASIPLSLSVALNVMNRRRLLDTATQANQAVVSQLGQENIQTQIRLKTLTEELATGQQQTIDLGQSQEISHLAVTQLGQENIQTRAELGTLTERLATVQQQTTDLNQGASNLQDYTQTLRNEQTKTQEIVGCLQEIQVCTETIRINANDAKTYYSRGLSYQHLEDMEAAIGDYTEAIRINPNYAEAYNTRGLVYAETGNKKGAVEDLREAAKLFFEEGDIAKYQAASDLSKKFHELSSQPEAAPEEVALERLFS